MSTTARGTPRAIVGGLLLAAATPPAWFPGAEFLVVGGLMAWFAIATAAARPLWCSYLLGCVHMACFSWSLHHVLWFAYVVVVLLGGGYFVLASAAARTAPSAIRVPAFAVAAAGSFWLRAVMPDLQYPHGQPAQCLWQWPSLLSAVTLAGEALVNLLLAGLAASAVELWRGWRLATPAWGPSRRWFLVTAVSAAAATAGGRWLSPATPAEAEATVRIVAIEPGFHPKLEFETVTDRDFWPAWRQLFEARLLVPSRAALRSDPPADLLLWPESSVLDETENRAIADGTVLRRLAGQLPASSTRLLLGANVIGDGRGMTPAALLLELPSAHILAHQEKRHLVPGGEFPPFFGWLPGAVAAWVRSTFAEVMRTVPDCAPGRELPPLHTARGIPFGALLCFDNAFPGPATAQVAAGARFLCVLSNEAWYRGGAQLQQLAAMTILRALETRTPIVRCTQDGWTMAVDGAGRLVAELPLLAGRQPSSRILQVVLPLGSGRLPPMAWLRSAFGPALGIATIAMLLHAFARWATLRAARTASRSRRAGRTGAPGSGS